MGRTHSQVGLLNEIRKKIKKEDRKKRVIIFLTILGIISVFVLAVLYSRSSLVGFSVQEETQLRVEQLNLEFSNTTIYEWQIKNPGELNSVKLAGEFSGEEVKVYLDDLLILDSSNIKEKAKAGLTGLAVDSDEQGEVSPSQDSPPASSSPNAEASSQDSFSEETEEEAPLVSPSQITQEEPLSPSETEEVTEENQTESKPEEAAEETNKSEPIKETNITLPEENITPTTEEKPKEETKEKLTKFTDVCEETCELALNKTSYNLRIEVSNATIKIKEIKYEIKAEIKKEETNITELNETTDLAEANITSVNTTSERIVIGKPVKWTKIIKLEKPEKIKIQLPKEAENISVNKIRDLYSEETEEEAPSSSERSEEPAAVSPSQNVSPSQEEPLSSSEQSEEPNSSETEEPASFTITSGITGQAIEEQENKGFLTRLFSSLTGRAVTTEETAENIELTIEDNASEYEITYETPAPKSFEKVISEKNKEIVISGPDELNYTDVLAYTYLENEAKASLVNIYHINNGTRTLVDTERYDKNRNGLIDYIEWNVPHLSNQTYELVIEIIKAEHLDENYTFIEDVYESVRALDGDYTLIPNEHILRVTFEQPLTKGRDITIYARANITSNIEVYRENSNETIAVFENISQEGWHKVYLINLSEGEKYETFDLKSIGDIEYDYVVDPITSQEFFEDCSGGNLAGNWTLDTWAEGSGGDAGWCWITLTGTEKNMTSIRIDLSAANIISANLSFTIDNDKLEAGDYLRVFVNSSTDGVKLLADTYSNTLTTYNIDLSTNISLNSGVYITGSCYTDASGDDCAWDNINVSTRRDNTAPNVTIVSPTNTTIGGTSITFNLTVQDDVSLGRGGCWYSLNSGTDNYTMSNTSASGFNATNSSIKDGGYNAKFWCNDSYGNVNNSKSISFSISNPPGVASVSVSPQKALNGTIVTISATITDNIAVSTAIAMLYYPNGTWWQNKTMSNTSSSYNASATAGFTPAGTYNITIWANDSENSANSTEKSWFTPYLNLSKSAEVIINGTFEDWNGIVNVSDIVGDAVIENVESWNYTKDLGGDSKADALAIDTNNNFIVAGYNGTKGASDWFIMKFNSSNDNIWNYSHDLGGNDKVYGIATDLNNSFIVGGYSSVGNKVWIMKFNSSNDNIWNYSQALGGNSYVTDIATDLNNSFIVAGYNSTGGVINRWWVMKFNSSNDNIWNYSRDLGEYNSANAVATDLNNNFIVAGENGSGWWVMKFNSSNDNIWNYSGDLGGSGNAANEIATYTNNNFIVVGTNGTAWLVMKFNSSNDNIWNYSQALGNGGNEAYSVATDTENNFIVGGYDGSGWFIMKFNSSNDNIWNYSRDLGGSGDSADNIAIDTNNNFIVGGYNGTILNYDSNWWLMKFSKEGGTNFDLKEVSLSNNAQNLFALINVNGSTNYTDTTKKYRLYISKNESTGNSTSPEGTSLAINYSYRIESYNSSLWKGYNSSNANVFNASAANDSSSIELSILLSDIEAATGDSINVTFETAGTSNYDFAPDYRSFLSFNITAEAGASDTEYPLFYDYWDDNATFTNSGTANFNVSVNMTNGTVLLEINGTNVTATNLSANIYNVSYFLLNGTYAYRWHSWGNGTSQLFNTSVDLSYTIKEDFVKPLITIVSPGNSTYNTNNNSFNISSNENLSYCHFTLNSGETNYTMTINSSNTGANYTNYSLAEGDYKAEFWCNDTANQINNSEKIAFTINATDISECRILDTPNRRYRLQEDISTNGNCLIITADNITIEGHGKTISGDNGAEDYGIIIQNAGNITVRDLNITNFGYGIFMNSTNSSTIYNNTILSSRNNSIVLNQSSNNNLTGNIVKNGLGAGIYLESSSVNNTVSNNSLESNLDGILAYGANSTFVNNTIESSTRYGIEIRGEGNAFSEEHISSCGNSSIFLSDSLAVNTNLSQMDVSDTDENAYDLEINSTGANNTYLIDFYFGNYSFAPGGNIVYFKNSLFGEIKFLQTINGSGTNLSNDVRIRNNSAVVESGNNIGLNRSAEIKLYGVEGLSAPQIKRGNVFCLSTICTWIDAIGPDYAFNVSFWTNYSIGSLNLVIQAPKNNSRFNQSSVDFNVSSDGNLTGCLLSINEDTNVSMTYYNDTWFNYTNTSIADEEHSFIISCNDTEDNGTRTDIYYFLVDTVYPDINFTDPTPSNGTTQSNTDIYVNVSANDSDSNVSTFIDFDNSLVGWWRMDDVNASGDPWDRSSYSNNGSKKGNAAQTDAGKLGKAFEFDGDGDTINAGNSNSLSLSSNFSIAFWVKTGITTVQPTIIGRVGSGGAYSQYWYIGKESGKGRVESQLGDGSKYSAVYSIFEINDSNWHSVIWVRKDDEQLIYVDGVNNTNISSINSGIGNVNPSTNVYIGGDVESNDYYFNGSLDDIMIFNRSLSAEEIYVLYANQSSRYLEHNFTGLANGAHTFKAYTQDLAGNVNMTETRQATVTAISSCQNLTIENATYVLTQNVSSAETCFNVLANNVTLDCSGYTINYSYGGTVAGYGVNVTDYNFTTIKNCVVKEGVSTTSSKYAIYFDRANNGTINNNTIVTLGSSGHGFYIQNSKSCAILSNTITPSYGSYGIYLPSSNSNALSNNIITGVAGTNGYGIWLNSASNNTLLNNTVSTSGSGGYGFYVYSNSDNNNFTSNKINTTGSSAYGIYVGWVTGNYPENNLFAENEIMTSNAYGIYLYSAPNSTLVGNKVNSSQSQSYVIYGTQSSHYNNTIGPDNYAEGLPVVYNYSVSNQILYQNQDLSQTYGQIICGWCENVTYDNITMANDGINLFYTNYSIVSNSVINTSKGYGIYLYQNSNSSNISGNNITTWGTNGYGIYLSTSSNGNNIIGNNVTTNGSYGHGVYLDTNSISNILSYNNILANTINSYGIHIYSGSNLSNIYNNRIITNNQNGYGVSLNSVYGSVVANNTIATSGNSAHGIRLNGASNSIFLNNSVTVTDVATYGIILISNTNNNTFSMINVKTTSSDTRAKPIYIYDTNHNFTIADSILNSSSSPSQEFYLRNGVTGGEWNFTNVTKSDGSKINVNWTTGANGTLNMHYYLDVNVSNNYTRAALENANVTLWTSAGTFKFSELTNSTGNIARKTLLEYTNVNNTLVTYYTPHTVNTSLAGYTTNSSTVNFSSTLNKWLNVQLVGIPNITSTFPANATITGNATINFTANATSPSGVKNVTLWIFNETGLYNSTTYEYIQGIFQTIVGIPVLLIEGIYNWWFEMYDYANNFATTTTVEGNRTLQVDLTYPQVTIIYPTNTTYTNETLDLNYSYTETNPDSCWYYNGSVNSSRQDCGTNWTGEIAQEGSNTWIVYINDSAGNTNSTNVTFSVDTTAPTVTIKTPGNNSYINNSFVVFNVSLSENTTACLLEIDGDANMTMTRKNDTWFNYTNTSIADGSHSFTVGCNDTGNNWGYSSTYYFIIDTGYPDINFTNPTPSNGTMQSATAIYVNVSANDSASNVSTFIDFDNSLVGWWRMDDVNSSGDVVDYTGRNNGSKKGNAVQTDWGKIGKAFEFDGNGDYINISNINISYSQYSFGAWVKFNDDYRQIILSGADRTYSESTTNPLGLVILTGTTRIIICDTRISTTTYSQSSTGVQPSLATWYYIFCVYNGTGMNSYINGAFRNGSTSGNGANGAIGVVLGAKIGQANNPYNFGSSYFNGTIDDIMIFNRSLSAEEIQALYANRSARYLEHNFTSLADGTHTLKAYSQDLAGNVNSTEERKVTIDATTPAITIKTPENNSYLNNSFVVFNVSINENTSACLLQINGNNNVSMTYYNDTWFNYTNTSIMDGNYTFIVGCNDTTNNWGYSSVYNFFVDTGYPDINFTNPTPSNGSSQSNTNIYVNVSVNDSASNISTFIDFDNSLVGWWRFSENSLMNGSTLYDYSSYGHNGTVYANDSSGNSRDTSTGMGYLGRGGNFDGEGDYIDLNSNLLPINGGAYTVSAWVKANVVGTSAEHVISQYQVGSSNRTISIYLNNDGKWNYFDSVNTITYTSNSNLGRWLFFTIVNYGNGSGTIYLNGSRVSSFSSVPNVLDISTLMGAGHSSNGVDKQYYFNGSIDDVMIFNRSLSAEEIRGLYANQSTKYVSNNFTNLSAGTHTFKAYVQDMAGNVNATETREVTIDTGGPGITITNPANNSNFNASSVSFNISSNENVTYCGLSINGNDNVSMTMNSSNTGANYTNTSLADGSYTFQVSCNDTSNNGGYSDVYYFSVDTVYPDINFTSPTPGNGSSQSNTDIYVNVSANDSASNVSTFIDFDNSLVGWWRMDDVNSSGDVVDYTGRNNGTRINATQTTAGKLGKGFSFDGDGDYVNLPITADWYGNNINNLTVVMWVKPTTDQTISPFGTCCTARLYVSRQGDPNWFIGINNKGNQDTGQTVDENSWQHLALVLNDGTASLYKNGIAPLSTTSYSQYTPDNTPLIGYDRDYFFNGSIDDVMVFNRSLSAEEIRGLYANTSVKYCYDNETEVMTDSGWKKFENVTEEDEILTLNSTSGETEWQKPSEKQDFENDNGEMYKIETENADGEKGELLVSPEHKVYVGEERGSTVNLASYSVMNLPSKSSELDFSLSSLENEMSKDSGLSCGILNQTIENIVSLLYGASSVKSQSFVTNILSSDIENLASSPLDSCLGLKTTSKSFLRNCNNSFLTFSSSRNFSFLPSDANDDIVASFNKTSCIMQSCFNMLLCEGNKECIKNLFYRNSCFKHLQDLPDHDSCAFESRLSMADFAVCNNIFVNFDSHCNNSTNNDYLSFSIEKNLSNFNLIKISDIYNNLNNSQNKQLVFLDEKGREIKIKSIKKENYNGRIYDLTVPNHIILVKRGNLTVWSGNSYNNFTGLSSGTHTFKAYTQDLSGNVNSTETRQVTVTAISSCQNLTIENATYVLTSNVSSTGTCFNVKANNVTLDCAGFTINYSYSGTVAGYGVNVTNYNFITIKNCVIKEGISTTSSKYPIYFRGANNGTIDNNTITASGTYGHGIYLYLNSNYNALSSNTITTSGSDGFGIYLDQSLKNNLTNNQVNTSNSKSYFIYGTSSSHYNHTIGNDNYAEGKPVNYTYNADNLVFNGVDFTTYGQVIFAYSRNITITNSNFSDDSLNLFYTNTSTISNNNINTSNGMGIYLYSSSNSNIVSGNTFITSGGYGTGIYLYSSSNSNTISNNIITTSNNSAHGIVFSGANSNNILNNTITTSGSSGYGIYLYSSSTNTISTNTINTSGGSGHGIRLVSSSNNNPVLNNTITTSGSSGYGIQLYSSSTNNSFSGMSIKTNNTNGYSFYIYDTNHNFTISDSILNSSLAPEIYIGNAVTGGEWNFTNVTRADGSRINISWIAGANGTLNMHWYLDVNVSNNYTKALLENANVTGWNKDGTYLFSESTNSSGNIARKTILEYTNENNTAITYYTPHTVNTSLSGYATNSSTVNFSSTLNKWLNVQLVGIPNITSLTPTNATITGNATINFTANVSSPSGIKNVTLWLFNETGLYNSTTIEYVGGVFTTIVGIPVLLVQGIYNWFFEMYDYANNFATTITVEGNRTLEVDLTYPQVTIIYPTNTTYTNETLDLNYTYVETHCDSIWYYNGSVNSSRQNCGANWTGEIAVEGSNTWTVYIDDTAGNTNSSSVTFNIDTTAPTVVIKRPENNSYINNSFVVFNASINENTSACLLEVDGDANVSMTYKNDTWFNYTNTSIADGEHSFIVGCNDTQNNWGYSDVYYFFVDTIYPWINFTDPTASNGTTQTATAIFVNVSANDSASNVSTFIDFDNSLVSWWRMDDLNSSGDVVDYTGRNNGTRINATQTTAGKLGKGFSFDGDGDYINARNDSSLNFNTTKNYTWSAWIKLNDFPESLQCYLSKDSPCAGKCMGYNLCVNSSGTTNELAVCADAGNLYPFSCVGTGYNVSKNTWIHSVITYNGSYGWGVYTDGVYNGIISRTVTSDTTSNYYIGAGVDVYAPGHQTPKYYFNGTIDDVMIFNRSLSAEEIKGLYANTSIKYLEHNFTNLSEGTHTFKAYVQDMAGNVNSTETRQVTIHIPPAMNSVSILPELPYFWNNLRGYCNASDADDDAEIQKFEYKWYNNSVEYVNGTVFKAGSISAGDYHTCGIRANDSRVLCWGQGDYGQLGDGSASSHNVGIPNLTLDSSAFLSVDAGADHTCGIRANDSRVLCWGRGDFGQLGDGSTAFHNVGIPNLTRDSSAYLSVSVGSYYTCGIRANDSRVLCWGDGYYGELGDSSAGTDHVVNVPNLTLDSSAYLSVSAGGDHTCGIRTNDSRVLCWGRGLYGRLGDGSTAAHNVGIPNLTRDSSAYLSVSEGQYYTCGLRANDSRVLCWGYGDFGQLGDGSTASHNVGTPNLTRDSSAYLSVQLGDYHTCGIRANDSRVLCWGYGDPGNLGDGSTASHNVGTPNLTRDSSAYLSVSTGNAHTCGIRANDSRVLCWGRGDFGRLGDGSTDVHSVGVPNLTLDSSSYSSFFANNISHYVSLIDNVFTQDNDEWIFSCRAYDGYAYSDWMNDSVSFDTTAPTVTIKTPGNNSYINDSFVVFNVSLSENATACLLEIDGDANVSMTYKNDTWYNYTNISIADGSHSFIVSCNDSYNNWGYSSVYYFTVDTVYPSINFTDPTTSNGTTQSATAIYVNVTANDSASGSYEGLCYQETANASTGDGSCGLSYSGGYSSSGTWTNLQNTYDGNWSSLGIENDPSNTAYAYVNYTKPTGALNTSLWQVKDASGTFNLTFGSCSFDGVNTIQLKVASTCFLAGTKVTMKGGFKNIEDINVGDYVLSYNEKKRKNVFSKVLYVFNHSEELTNGYLVINNKIRVTPNHRVMLNGVWQEIGNAEVGDYLYDSNYSEVEIENISRVYANVRTYNLEVENTHIYYAEDVLVHNLKTPNVQWYCYNGTGWVSKLSSGISDVYEEAMIWNISNPGTTSNNISTFIDFDNSLVGWWRMDDTNQSVGTYGAKVYDTSGYGNNGTAINQSHQVDNGKLGKGFEFDGAGDYININDSGTLLDFNDTYNYTWSAWIKYNEFPESLQCYISKDRCGGKCVGYNLCINNSGTTNDITVCAPTNDAQLLCGSTGSYISKNNWIHSVIVYNGSYGWKLYVNGVYNGTAYMEASSDLPSNFYLGAGADVSQSNQTPKYFFNGSIDDVMVFNRSLSAEEIYGLYANTSIKYLEHNFTNLSEGTHTFKAYTQDLAGNVNATETREVTISGNQAPNITYISSLPNTDLTEENYTNIQFNVTVYDENGASNINYSSVIANFSRANEDLRQNLSCANISGQDTTNSKNFSCTIEMWYWDENGDWNITVYAEDNDGESVINDTEFFQVNLLQALKIAPSEIFWSSILTGSTNQTAANSTIINNTGNYNLTGKIQVNATNLYNGTSFIDVANISVGIDVGSECNGTIMSASENAAVSGVILEPGNLSTWQYNETIYYCMITVPSNIPSGTYDTTTAGSWTIRLFLAAFAVAGAKGRRKKKISLIGTVSIPITIFTKELGSTEAIVKYLKENMKLRYSQIAKLLNRNERTVWTVYNKAIKKKKEELKVSNTEVFVPTSIFESRKLTILEAMIVFLRDNGMRNIDIARALERDPRNTHDVYNKAVSKIK